MRHHIISYREIFVCFQMLTVHRSILSLYHHHSYHHHLNAAQPACRAGERLSNLFSRDNPYHSFAPYRSRCDHTLTVSERVPKVEAYCNATFPHGWESMNLDPNVRSNGGQDYNVPKLSR